ncbi:unnamed protein product, partial [marine sediment metagenome]
MAQFKSEELEREAARITAALMASSARTAPKAMGIDAIKTMVVDADDLEHLAGAMENRAKEQPPHLAPIFVRDAQNVRNSSCVLLIGVTGEPKRIEQPLDCGACGYKTCEELLNARKREGKDFNGPNCIFQAMDLGIALGSAAKLASELNVDNRMMYTIGATAKKLQLLDSDIVIGIPLSIA